jgi:protein ImuB
MPRIACLLVPDFPLAALRRLEPDLRGRAVATVDRDDPRAPLTAVSAEARTLGARLGVSAAQATALSSSLVLRRPGPEMLCSAHEALLDVADSFSPRVEAGGWGEAFLEIEGLQSLFGSESHLASSLAARLRRVGLEGRVAVASTKTAAWLAARNGDGVTILPPGRERERLASTPLSVLAPPRELALALERWGVHTLGALAALPPTAVGWRFGETGLRLWRTARGEDEEPLSARSRPCRFEETVDCGYAVDSFEPLSFLLRAALERLTARLGVRSFRAGDLALSLRLEGGAGDEFSIPVAAPTNEVKSLLGLVRLHFDRRPPRGAVEWFRLAAAAERPRPVELDLFVPAGPAPRDLDQAIARLTAIAGAERVGRPVALDVHRPDAFGIEPFVSPPSTVAAGKGPPAQITTLALRAFRPPAAIEVVCDRGRPDFVRGGGGGERFGGRVVHLAGPWRLSGEWWRVSSFGRDYYDAELSDGCVYRIYREDGRGEWFAEGVYD